MLEHEECLVIVGVDEVWDDDAAEEEPVESLRVGAPFRTGIVLSGWALLALKGCGADALPSVGHAKFFAATLSATTLE